jgi:two-component system nitrogen regulation sensor histidine kinase NtrY
MASPLKHLWVQYPPRKRRYLIIVFFIFLLIGGVQLAAYLTAQHLNERWEEVSEVKTAEIVVGVRSAFDGLQNEAASFARRVSANPSLLRRIGNEKPDIAGIFLLLEELNEGKEFSLDVYDQSGELLAWTGREAAVDSSAVRIALRREILSTVSQGALYTYLTALAPIVGNDGAVRGVLAASLPVEVNYPLNNRFLISSGLQRELSNEFGTVIRFEFGEETESSKDGRIASADIVGLSGKKIGTAFIEKPNRSASLQENQRRADSATSILVALLPLIFIAGVWPEVRAMSFWIQGVLVIVLIWATRYLWIGVNFPSIFFSQGMFDPSKFASPFGFGLTRSIGELLISSIFLFCTAAFVLYTTASSLSLRRKRAARSPLLILLIGLFVFGGLFVLFTRGFAEAIRSAVFDSTLRYIDPTTFVPSVEVGAMLLGILLLSVSFVFVGAMVFLLSVNFCVPVLAAIHLDRVPAWVIVAVVFIAEILLFGRLHPNPQTSDAYRLFVFGLIALFSGLLQRDVTLGRHVFRGKSFVIAVVISILIATPVLDAKIHERDRQALRLYAAELTRPVDNWLRVVLQETLDEFVNDDDTIHGLVTEDKDLISGAAFRLWAKSSLSREGLNCVVGIIRKGRIESLFNLGLLRSEATSLVAGLGDFTEPKVFLVRSGREFRGLDRYVGTAPIKSPQGAVLGNVAIVIVSGQSMLLRTETPEILQTPSALLLETQFRNLIVSEFSGRRLLQSTGEDIVRNHEVPVHVYDALLSGKSAYVWAEETLDQKSYESVYTLLQPDSDRPRILSLSMETLDVRWHIFNLLKVVFLYLVIGTIVAGLAALIAATRRGGMRVTFQGKLLAALLSLATIPLLLLSYYDRKFTEESRLEILRYQVEDELRVVSSNLLNYFRPDLPGSHPGSITNSLCERIAQETGTDFNVYIGNEVYASSRPELYDADLIDARLDGPTYRATILEGKKFFLRSESIGRYPFLVGYQRLEDQGGEPLAIVSVFTAFKHQAVDQELYKRSAFVFGAYAAIMILIVLFAFFFASSIASPVKKLTDGMKRVSRGDLDLTLEVKTRDELGELVRAFNKMTHDLKRIQKELAAAERELAWREMAKQVAHEIKNPLTPMRLSIQHLRQAYADRVTDFQTLLEEVSKTIIEQVDALSRIASEFSQYARMPERRHEACDVHGLLTDAIRLFDQEENIEFSTAFAKASPIVVADKEELRRVFINVFRNAVQAIPGKGEVRVATSVVNDVLEVVIADTGRGIPDEIKSRLFEPNFSTKTEGMGLGLAISKQIILDLNGHIEIESALGKGTKVRIILPIAGGREKF